MAYLKLSDDMGNEDVYLYYEDYGSGRPVVLLHGWPLSHRAWEAQISILVSSGYRVVIYDRRGFGESSRPWNGYHYDQFASDLNEIMEHLDLVNATLVGYSMGGGEVVRYLSEYGSERVASIVLAAAIPPYLYKNEAHPEGAIDEKTIINFEESLLKDRPAFIDEFIKDFFSASVMGEKVSDAQHVYHREIALFASPKATLDCIRAFSKTDFRDDISRINVPVLLIHGDSDSIVPYEKSAEVVLSMLPQAELTLIKGGPHGINLTHKDEFNQGLLRFLGTSIGANRPDPFNNAAPPLA